MSTMLTTSFAKTEDLGAELREAIIELCIDAHQEEEFRHLFSYIPSGGRHFVGYLDEKVVAHAVVTTRHVYLEDGRNLKTGYIDAVSVSRACQGQGYGSQLMRYLGQHIDDYEIGWLETERVSFYAGAGWQKWLGPLAGRKDGAIELMLDQEPIMVLELPKTPSLDLASTLTIEFDGRYW